MGRGPEGGDRQGFENLQQEEPQDGKTVGGGLTVETAWSV